MSFNTPIPDEFSDPWYSGLQSAWSAITSFVNNLASQVSGNSSQLSTHDSQISSNTTAIGTNTTQIGTKVSKTTSGAPNATQGWWQILNLTSYSTNGTDAEPFIVNGFRTALRRAFWVNENGSPRGASVNDEPALKLFGPEANTAYAGLVFQVLSRWQGAQSQQNLFGVRADGKPIIGTAGTIVGAWTIVLNSGDPVPTGLPAGTVIVRLS